MAKTTHADPVGRSISLFDDSWEHIRHGHPEVAAHRQLVEECLARPFSIHFSLSNPDCRLYYGRGPRSRVMMVVVANIVRGAVVTAYLTNRSRKGIVEWSLPTP